MFWKKENNDVANTENAEAAAMTDDPIKELLKKQNKQLMYMRIMCISVVAIAVMLFIVCAIIVPKAVSTIAQANTLMTEASTVMDNANTTLEGIDAMSKEITTAADGINGLVDNNAEVLTDSMNKLNSIDFDGLNKAIGDLQSVVEPLASFFGKFGR